MLLKEYLKQLQDYAESNPDMLDMPIVTTRECLEIDEDPEIYKGVMFYTDEDTWTFGTVDSYECNEPLPKMISLATNIA